MNMDVQMDLDQHAISLEFVLFNRHPLTEMQVTMVSTDIPFIEIPSLDAAVPDESMDWSSSEYDNSFYEFDDDGQWFESEVSSTCLQDIAIDDSLQPFLSESESEEDGSYCYNTFLGEDMEQTTIPYDVNIDDDDAFHMTGRLRSNFAVLQTVVHRVESSIRPGPWSCRGLHHAVSSAQQGVLQETYETSPYPNIQTRRQLASDLGLRFHTVNTWFSDRRSLRQRTRIGLLRKSDPRPASINEFGVPKRAD
ncbi:uncharacterized protein LOC100374146 [Saccoglossus kowalevskii]|uniref:Uncharacterized protein LOC100374146 n=1 Tax=Saccoglossus kowalevskii TaxID=10224 RepID=A0ABM0H0Z9_SACKO|nr:PREDICTED: uncharacterized protein LOC100374146 [Saccoglossus kowalevskii]